MAKLPADYEGSATHEDIIKLLHDEVVSLCQKNYSTVSGLEIDGIICISFLDTKEQQVVKIHKTLKSVFADTKKKTKRQKTHEQPSFWLNGKSGNTGIRAEQNANFQNDINALSNLLRDTNAAIRKDIEEKTREETVSKQSKRKRTQPKQRVTSSVEPIVENSTAIDPHEVNSHNPSDHAEEESGSPNAPGINPFIHRDVVTVKAEKVDPEYEAAEHSQPKIVNVSSLYEIEQNKTELTEGRSIAEKTKVSSIIERIIEKEIPKKQSLELTSESREENTYEKKVEGNAIEDSAENTCENQSIEIKVEKNPDESEYGGFQGLDQGDFTGASSDNMGTGGSNSETDNYECLPEWLYNQNSSLGDIGRTALLDKLQEKGSLALTGYPREIGRAVRDDPQGRSWIEMVKDNVNKYQAALNRSGKGRTEVDETTDTCANTQTSKLSKSSSSLVALLKQPTPDYSMFKEVTPNSIMNSVRSSRGSSVPLQSSEQISDRSTSSSPIVKIEVDEAMNYETYSQSDGEVNVTNGRKEISELFQENKGMTVKAPQGKLESRYPALFSHLQQAKQASIDNQDQSDSLVNRLPFISFQELFSQASTSAASPRLSESKTMELLAQARVNPYPSKEKQKAQRKIWNWKKRQVRPRDAEGRIISPIPVNLKDTVKKKRHLGFHAAIKKTFSKKGHKSDEEEDKDWQPEVDNVDVDSDNNESVPITTDSVGTPGRRTRLSCGEKTRINFAELENSDIEMDEEVNDVEEVDMFPAESKNQFIDNVNPHVYTDTQEDIKPVIHGGSSEQLLAAFSASSEQLNNASNSTSEQYKCSLCGLEFNQEYRWHYHLIKVHGITADKEKLFR